MAECSAHNNGGDSEAGIKYVIQWVVGGAIVGAIVGAFMPPLTGANLPVAILGALAGAALAFYVGSAVGWFSRLKDQNPNQITIVGTVKCAGQNPFGLQPWTDGDWTCNMGDLTLALPADLPVTAPGAINREDEVRLRAAPGSGLLHAFPSFNEDALKTPILHCEISSHIGSYCVVGGAVGSVVGFGLGIAAGIAICIAIGIFTFGIGALLCAIIVAALAFAGAAVGGFTGETVGATIGWIVDEVSDFDKLGKTIESNENCTLVLTGTWVTDISHQHNEIHDIEAVQVVACSGFAGPPLHPNAVGVVAIGRQPAGDGGQIK